MKVLLFLVLLSLVLVNSSKVTVIFKIVGTPGSAPSATVASQIQSALHANQLRYPLSVLNYTVSINGTSTSETTLTSGTPKSSGLSSTSNSMPSGTSSPSTSDSPETKAPAGSGVSQSPSMKLVLLGLLGVLSFGQIISLRGSLFALVGLTLLFGHQADAMGTYANCKVLDNDVKYLLYWTVSGQNINFAIQAQTQGWLALGLSIDGTMSSGGKAPGSDIFMAYHGANCPNGCVNDYSTLVYNLPLLDESQDLTFVSSTFSEGILTVEFRRALATSDANNDLPITLGVTRKLIWSVNDHTLPLDNQTFSKHNHQGSLDIDFGAASLCPTDGDATIEITFEDSSDIFDQNAFVDSISSQFNVSASRIAVIELDVTEDAFCPECSTITFQFKNYSVPSTETTYTCLGFQFPAGASQHVIRFDPGVDNSQVLHHMVLYQVSSQYSSTFQDCSSMPSGAQPMWAWAPGSDAFILPKEVGVLVGGSNPTYVALQFHYNNPTGITGLKDSSYVKMYTTTNLRPNNAGLMFLGPVTSGISIPAGETHWHHSGACTSSMLAGLPHNLTVFAQMSHMHYTGKTLWSDHYRNGLRIGDLGFTPIYDFSAQHFAFINATLMPGDDVITHCIYDTRSRNTTTYGGEDSKREMCLNAIMYYPNINVVGCSNVGPGCDCDYQQPCLIQPQCTRTQTSCTAIRNCTTCSSTTGCGWCDSTAVSGCVPSSVRNSCLQISGQWNSCSSMTGTPCTQSHNDCTSCNADTANGCSYCFYPSDPLSSFCVAGTATSSRQVCTLMGASSLRSTCNA